MKSQTEEYDGQLLNVAHVHIYTIQNNAKLMSTTEEYYGQLLNVPHVHMYTIQNNAQNNAKLMSHPK